MLNKEQRDKIEAFANELDELRTNYNEALAKRDKLIIHLYDEGLTNAEIARLFNMKPQNTSTIIKRS